MQIPWINVSTRTLSVNITSQNKWPGVADSYKLK